MYRVSNKDREEILFLLSVYREKDLTVPDSRKTIKEANYSRRAALIIKKLNRLKKE